MYKVIKRFSDLQDNCRDYNVGDVYPRKGLTVSEKRIAELSGCDNLQGAPLIEEVKEAPKKTTTKKAAKKTADK